MPGGRCIPVAAISSRASDGFPAIACSAAADRLPASASRPSIAARRLSAALTRSAVTAASASSFLAACTARTRSARRASPNRNSASKTKANVAHTAAVADWLASPPAQAAASRAARTAATNHDAGDGTVSKTSPASHPDGVQFAPNQANGT